MATSGTVTYSVNELDIMTDAMETIGCKDPLDALRAEDVVTCRRKLNMIIKQWTANIDFAPGLKLWTRRKGYVFLQKDQTVYSLGPSGDNATESYVDISLAANGAALAGSVTVSSAASLSTAMYMGVLLDTGAFHWTTINGAPAGAVVTLTTALPSAAASGNKVYAYTTKLRRPFEIVTCVRRDTSGNDTPVDPQLSVQEYEAIPDKSTNGSVAGLYFEAARTNAKIYTDCAPDDATDVLRMTYLSYIEDFSAANDDVDLPAEWFRPLSAQLAFDLCPVFQVSVPTGLPLILKESLAMAKNAYPENSTASYQSCPDDY
ncbi:MAG: hypothetical protein Q7T46_11430 [Polaromonas sp.]|nr:hypothetical protein [Polaromonas sp.]